MLFPLILLAWPPPAIPPHTELPVGLETCVIKADLCVSQLEVDACGEADQWTRLVECVGPYEDCSAEFVEAHQPSCRIDYVWCRLEADSGAWPEEWLKYCAGVYDECPTI